ncbi:Aspartic proteinase A2 [Camellia lanceoleosa]|uniref:Aspartic proteinase A2 n=1 Tax=Camellia lanceoleosa TaxID=1840588 RepID=A0ACC0GT37_9ERIC|nr:Aspartic proteinase A2 [Camellia lanceoleosa]
MGNILLLTITCLSDLACIFGFNVSSDGLVRIALKRRDLDLNSIYGAAITRGEVIHANRTSCKIHYGSRSIFGFFSQDNVRVGDVIIKDQVFTEATKEGLFMFLLALFDGIIELGFQDIAVGQVSPLRYNMIKQGLVSQQVFSLLLNRDPESKIGGEIVFGGVDWRHFRGDHTFAPIAQNGYWQIEVGDIIIASNSTGLCKDGCAAIVDSGSSFIAGPTVCHSSSIVTC